MEHSNNLKLPYIMSAQAQKHVTHNEAIRALDVLVQAAVKDQHLVTPPASPTEGDSYIVASSATADWADKDQQIASWQDGAWMFYPPQEGWLVWVIDEAQSFVFNGLIWSAATSGGGANLNPASGDLIGINATADTTNRLSIKSPASLFNHQGNGHQLKINKNTVTDTSSLLFQTGFSGRAEFGLTGDDDFHMKVSPDGSTFFDSIVIDKDTGAVTFPNTVFGGGSVSSVFGRAGAVTAVAGDYNFDEITGVSQDVLIGRLTPGSGPQEALTAGQVRSFLNIEEGASSDLNGAEIKALYEAEENTNGYDDTAIAKLSTIEPAATTDQTDNEIEAAYNNQVTQISSSEIIAGTQTNIRRYSPADLASLAALHGGGGGSPATDIAFGSDAQGDVAYFDGSNYTRLAAGTSGQFLKTQGTGNNPIWQSISGGGDMLTANNLSDVTSFSEARSNLNVPSFTDFFEHELRIVDLEGDALGTSNRIADPFDDETDVDTGNSINQVYSAIDGCYAPDNSAGSDLVPTMTATTTGGVTVTGSSSINGTNVPYKCFDDADPTGTGSTTMWHTAAVGGVGVLGIDFGSTTLANKYTMSSGAGSNASNAPTSFTFEGSDDESNWDVLDIQSGLSWGAIEKKEFNLVASENYRYYRFNITVAGGGTYIVIGECEIIYAAMTNMTLVSKTFTADSAPDNARLLFLIKPNEAITINTDIIGSISRDDGTTFTDAVLVEKLTYSDGTKLYEAETVDISGQPSGTSMKWKLSHDNGKDIQFFGVVLQWS